MSTSTTAASPLHDMAPRLSTHQRVQQRGLWALALVLTALALLLPLLSNSYWLKTFTSAMTLSVAVAGTALLYGQLGLVSLCQYALVGVGGWITLRLSLGFGWAFELCVLAGGLTASAAGMLAGLPALRLKGLYLALVTLMMAGGYQVLVSATGFPDGGGGWLGKAQGMDRVMMARPAIATGDSAYLIYVLVWLALVLGLIEWHRRSKPGRSWALIRRGEAAATSAGVNVLLYQSWAFGLAGFCAGIAGGLLAGGVGQLDGRAFAAADSVMLFALTVVGGAYHWLGALLAGLLLRAVPALLTEWEVNGFLAQIFFGAALLHALITAPRGIAGQWLAGLQALLARSGGRR
ncbi:MAG: hypothetical protein RJA44_840 [Pseudomonadota bacterium]|jgi:branched-chain amino acid transport system permease protein